MLQLAALVVGITAALVLAAFAVPSSPADLQAAAATLQPATALALVAAGALLTCALFPYPVLAATSGLLFGTLLGTVVAVTAETLGAVAALLIARRWGAGPVAELAGERLGGLLEKVGRRGFVAVALR